jgi:large subunit ribosomal protein L35Ae
MEKSAIKFKKVLRKNLVNCFYQVGDNMEKALTGLVKNYRRGRKHLNPKQAIIEVDGITSRKEAFSLVGSKVVWVSPAGKKLYGTIVAAHGNKGAVRVRFRTPVPGQAIGQTVEIMKKAGRSRNTQQKDQKKR